MTPNVDSGEDARQVPSPPTERVIAVMHLLSTEPERHFTLAEISRSLGLSRATGHAILNTLAHHHWVIRHEDTASYSWGPAIDAMARPTRVDEFLPPLRDLHDSVGAQVFLARRDGSSLVVTHSVGISAVAPQVTVGLRTPLVAPFGRDYAAWDSTESVKKWLEGTGSRSTPLRKRLSAVLAEVRKRGYVIERLSREYVRVYSALQALAVDGEPDLIAARLAGVFGDLTLVDYLPDELDTSAPHQIATISAPIKGADGTVIMSVTAAPFKALTRDDVREIGAAVREVGIGIEHRLTQ